jgi:hypothetical protein
METILVSMFSVTLMVVAMVAVRHIFRRTRWLTARISAFRLPKQPIPFYETVDPVTRTVRVQCPRETCKNIQPAVSRYCRRCGTEIYSA